jgi:hypothetical protein
MNNDVKALLDRAAGPRREARPDELAADLARGRSGLRRRRAKVIAGGAFALAVAAGSIAGGASLLADDPRASRTVVAEATDPEATDPGVQSPRIRFVAYTDPQPEGFHVTTVPEGWQIQAVNKVALVIAPPELINSDPRIFLGKLLVMLESVDATDRPSGSPIKVGDRDGILVRSANYGHLWWSDAAGHAIHVQWPLGAGWSDAEIAGFAAGVEVLPAAVAPVG